MSSAFTPCSYISSACEELDSEKDRKTSSSLDCQNIQDVAGYSMSNCHDQPRYTIADEFSLREIIASTGNFDLDSNLRRLSGPALSNKEELRRLFIQFKNIPLGNVSSLFSRLESAGYKAGYMKQLHAMIWLRKTCQKSFGSVPRNKVFHCYNLHCNENRVSAMNPASFGKMVRVVFPHVETRRVGIRGETKTHYLHFTVNPKNQAGIARATKKAAEAESESVAVFLMRKPVSQVPLCHDKRSAQYCADSMSKPTQDAFSYKSISLSDCQTSEEIPAFGECEVEILTIKFRVKRDNIDQQASRMIQQMIHFTKDDFLSKLPTRLKLPDISCHLPKAVDVQVGISLAAIYRSHCHAAIQSFQTYKEESFLKQFSSFNNTLTDPVKRLLEHQSIISWAYECDWRMYQSMLAVIAPYVTQEISEDALATLRSISQKLCDCISKAVRDTNFEILLVRLIAAKVFCNLLEKFLDLNKAASIATTCLDQASNRNQMWYDYRSSVVCQEAISKANIPSCAERFTSHVLESHIQYLLSPSTEIDTLLELPFTPKFGPTGNCQLKLGHADEDYRNSCLEKWVFFAFSIPEVLRYPCSHCIIQKVNEIWNVILHRLTLEKASSIGSWWSLKVFFCNLVVWKAAMGGYMGEYSAITEMNVFS